MILFEYSKNINNTYDLCWWRYMREGDWKPRQISNISLLVIYKEGTCETNEGEMSQLLSVRVRVDLLGSLIAFWQFVSRHVDTPHIINWKS